MNYEQRYKEALERAKDYFKANQRIGELEENDILSDIFPELKESTDERIRKALLNSFREIPEPDEDSSEAYYAGMRVKDIIAWLEKQGKKDSQVILPQFTFDDVLALQCCIETIKKVQEDNYLYKQLEGLHGKIYDAYYFEKHGNNADKAEPKFKIKKGKWYVCIRDLLDNYANRAFCKGDIYLSTQDRSLIPANSNVPFEIACPDTYFRDWTIEDAKDGDPLDANGAPFIYKKHDEDCVYFYCGVNLAGEFIEANRIDTWNNNYKVYPATKEQHDLLFQKMKEAGWEWVPRKKELIKL